MSTALIIFSFFVISYEAKSDLAQMIDIPIQTIDAHIAKQRKASNPKAKNLDLLNQILKKAFSAKSISLVDSGGERGH